MLRKLLQTPNDGVATLLRITLGLVMFPHASQKVLGWFGGGGISGTMGFMTEQMGIPAVFAILAIVAESAGSLGLILGLLTRVAAFGIFMVMAVAVTMVHLQFGFFMNWMGSQKGEGFEYHILAIGIAIAVMIRGGGAASIDRQIAPQPSAI